MGSVKLTSYVSKAIKANKAGVDAGMLKTAIMVTSQAKLLAPVNKIVGIGGQLRDSIMWKGNNKTGGNTDGDKLSYNPKSGYIVGSAVEYAVYQEFGTRKMEAQPYLRPAIDKVVNGTKTKKAMNKAMYDSVRHTLYRSGNL